MGTLRYADGTLIIHGVVVHIHLWQGEGPGSVNPYPLSGGRMAAVWGPLTTDTELPAHSAALPTGRDTPLHNHRTHSGEERQFWFDFFARKMADLMVCQAPHIP